MKISQVVTAVAAIKERERNLLMKKLSEKWMVAAFLAAFLCPLIMGMPMAAHGEDFTGTWVCNMAPPFFVTTGYRVVFRKPTLGIAGVYIGTYRCARENWSYSMGQPLGWAEFDNHAWYPTAPNPNEYIRQCISDCKIDDAKCTNTSNWQKQ